MLEPAAQVAIETDQLVLRQFAAGAAAIVTVSF